MASLTQITILLTVTFSHAFAYNILAIASLPLHSHYMAFQTLFRELAIRGHNVTVLNNYPDENPPSNLKFVDVGCSKNNVGYTTPLNFYETYDSKYLHLLNFYKHIAHGPGSTRGDCENFFTNENLKAHFAKGVKYDVIFVELFMGECGLAYAEAMYDAPIIGITSHVMLPTTYPRLGIPFDISSDAFYFSKAGPNPTLYHKLETIVMNFVFSTFNKFYLHRIIYEVFDKYIPGHNLDIEKAAKERMKMVFVNQYFSLTGARLLSPQVLEIAGIHIGQQRTVPKEIEDFLSNAHQGAIYVSFGSNLKANTMTPAKRQEFLDAFMRIPQKVLWKYENGTLPEVYANKVYTSSWMPQLDILCHPKILAFVSHGGMLSMSEASHCGKPLVIVPFFGDQFSNAAAAEHVGLGKVLHFDKLTGDTLAGAIRETLTPRMQENAMRISRRWHDRPVPILDSAIFWTEYVARHRDSPPSLPSKQSTWYESILLDVAVAILMIVAVIFAIISSIVRIIKFVFVNTVGRLFRRDKSKKE